MGMTEVRWKVDRNYSGFEQLFFDYAVMGYSGQDHVQVGAVVQLAVQKLQDCYP